ncbi:unnamed protein product [Mytilus coruscus]|uniref:C2H2-type domain-containing protein n=1 Tax=Mytilus coruscus TaxID=42192 RepID=A0A6J8B9S5_MYTCO|nr:unnamed protein product [Mytilus coruscus]
MDRDPDLVRTRGYLYVCGRCPFRGEKSRVINHFYKYHVPLEHCDYFCTLCMFRCRSEYDLNSHTRGYTKHVREVQTLQKNGQTYNERNYLKKASVANIFEDGRDIVKQSYAESQKHWASRAGIRIKSFPKPTKPSLSKYTATAISVAPKPLAPLETSTATCTAASIDSYTRLF